MRCVILDDYQNVAREYADFGALDTVALTEHIADVDELVAAVDGAEIIVAMRERTPFPRAVLERLPRLRLLVTTGSRNTSIDVVAAADLGITVCGTDSLVTPTVEHTWALILGLARHLAIERDALRADGPWQSTVGTDLAGATLGLVGLGRIGTRVADIARAFGMRVIAWSPNLTIERAEAATVELAGSLAALLGASDFVSIHLVLGDRTRGLIGAAELAQSRRLSAAQN